MPDPLSELVGVLRPKGFLWKRLGWRGEWAVSFPSDHGMIFGRVIDGRCQIKLSDGVRIPLQLGDFVLLTTPQAWELHSVHGNSSAVDYSLDEVLRGGADRHAWDEEDHMFRIMAGHFTFEAPGIGLLEKLLPPLLVFSPQEVETNRLGTLLEMIDEETKINGPGQEWVQSRLLELMLASVFRLHMDRIEVAPPGMLAGLAHPKIGGAIRMIHGDVKRRWTVNELATCAGMSRSAFARHFSALMGMSPIDYVSRWRITLAMDALEHSSRSIQEIALHIGYSSATAFSTAFRKIAKSTPAAYRNGVSASSM